MTDPEIVPCPECGRRGWVESRSWAACLTGDHVSPLSVVTLRCLAGHRLCLPYEDLFPYEEIDDRELMRLALAVA